MGCNDGPGLMVSSGQYNEFFINNLGQCFLSRPFSTGLVKVTDRVKPWLRSQQSLRHEWNYNRYQTSSIFYPVDSIIVSAKTLREGAVLGTGGETRSRWGGYPL